MGDVCANCGKVTDLPVPVFVYDEDELESEETWCPECVADLAADEAFGSEDIGPEIGPAKPTEEKP